MSHDVLHVGKWFMPKWIYLFSVVLPLQIEYHNGTITVIMDGVIQVDEYFIECRYGNMTISSVSLHVVRLVFNPGVTVV